MRKLAFVVLLVAQTALSAESVLDQTIATLLRVQDFEEVAISSDGSHVAWIKVVRDATGQRTAESGVYLDGARIDPREASGLAWSSDGRLAYVADQLYVDGRAITSVKGALAMPKWSSDGKSIAVLFIENASRKGGALEAMTPPSGDVELQVEEQRIAIVDVAAKTVQFATPPDMYVYDYDWSPDGRSLVAETAFGAGEDHYWIAQLWRFDLGDMKGRSIYKPALQIATPRWSPDGKSIAFIEGLMSDQGSTGGDIFLIPADGGAATNLTARMPASATTLQWTAPGTILFGENFNGLSGVATVTTAGTIRQLWSGEGHVSAGRLIGVSVARDGKKSAVIRESFQHAPEIAVGPIGAWQQETHVNDDVQPLWGRSENLNWTSDGFRVQGWLLHPRDENRKNGLIVQVHGGPSSGVTSQWPSLNTAALVANGYTVLMPNPRGSYGQGEAFTQANVKDFGYGDLRDIVRGVDVAVAASRIDKDRVGIWGWSYGGYMTMWAVTQTQRFRAAVAGAGVANWQSYYGQNSIDEWMIPFFGASVYDDPHIYARSSPIEFIRNVKTPTLVLVGDRDGEVPAPQSFEFWHALKTIGVKTKLVVYPNEGHRMRNPEHRRDIARRLVLWFDENL
ncbi:MAG TPA: S9 family peptidase [Thermoanaerobaculia bacterium]|nr:S9 family peptidase [Thermoanaerobaculia bacterium]